MAKAAPRRPAQASGARVSDAELRELLAIEKRIMEGREPIVDGEEVIVQTMRGLVRDSKRRRA